MRRTGLHLMALCGAIWALSGCSGREIALDGLGESESGEGTSTESETEESTESETTEGETETEESETEESETGNELPEGLCEEVCASTFDTTCFPEQACVETCEAEGPSWPPELYESFELCAQTTPLCFETLDNCMFNSFHGDTLHTVRVDGAGFEDYEGLTITLWHDPQLPPFGSDATIIFGGFAFEFTDAVTGWAGESSLLFAHVDVDDNGACDIDSDIGDAFRPEWNGDWLDPVFEFTLTPEDLDNIDFACSFQP